MPVAPAPSGQPHNNHQLFSDHYLNHTLPQRADWNALLDAAGAMRAQIAALFQAYAPSANEAQTEDDFIKPVLRALGHIFDVQPALKTPPEGTKKPDYVFYRTQAERDANKGKTLTDALPRQGGYAVGDAKYWDRPLDFTVKGKAKEKDVFSNKNPDYQIYFYILHSGVEWGILTNGRLWRLYHRDTAHKLDRYYEVDLPALLQNPDPGAFLYFYAFFYRSAFDAHTLGVSAILRESLDYARGVGDTLKSQVYDALRHLAQGFLDYTPNGLANDAATRKEIYDSALILLYRLLFVLYAEARELLPVRESQAYRDSYSLYALKQTVAADLDAHKALLPTTATLWPRFKELFGIIDLGSPPLRVATFNGGLFDPKRHPFLHANAVGDAHLQRALDKLARVGGQFVDYRDLSVRHLGTIYEGLLEYHLDDKDVEEGWTVALLNDKGERKASGSYYTPDYIVKYVVEQAVGPMLRQAVAGQPDDAARVRAVLAVNVLDPSMGSGHFLVETTEFIARFLIDLAITPGPDAQGEADLLYWKRRVAQSCVYGVDLNPLAVELAKLSLWLTTVAKDRPLSFLDHHLRAGNALVGARLADLQFGGAKPKAKKKSAEPAGQLTMLADDTFRRSLSTAVDFMWLIEASAAQTVADVKQQEQLYARLRESLSTKYSRLANLVTASHFGVPLLPALWRPLSAYALNEESASHPKFAEWVAASDAAADRLRFFHWELEFPEIYFDKHGKPLGDRAGFDAVVGNPPYVRQEKLAIFKPFLRDSFAAFHSVADLYLYFYEQGLKQLQQDGLMAFITSGTFARANFAKAFRAWLPTEAQVEAVIDFGENQPFEEAEMVRPSIMVVRKAQQGKSFRALFMTEKIPASLEQALEDEGVECDAASLEQPEWTFQHSDSSSLFAKLAAAGRPLKEVVGGKMYRGVSTGLNEAFIINTATQERMVKEDPACTAIIKQVVRGEDLRPWYQKNEGEWLIFTRRGIDIDAYPVIRAYLQQFREQLEPCPRGWAEKDVWLGRKPGTYKWYEIQDSVDYYPAFDRLKVVWPDIAKLPRFSWNDDGMYLGNTGYVIPDADPSLLGILQSRVMWYAISQVCQPLRLRAGLWQYRILPQFISRLPIPTLNDADREAVGGLAMEITGEAKARYALHEKVRHRLRADLGTPGIALNQKLTAWWTLDFPSLQAELVKVFKKAIPVKDRDEWEAWFGEQRAAHQTHTDAIIRRETDLNARVYALFGLAADEIKLIEAATKYKYGEV